MTQLALFHLPTHHLHAQAGHPERPERIEAIRSGLEASGYWQGAEFLPAADVPDAVLKAVHTPGHVQRLEAAAEGGNLDADTYFTPHSYTIARQTAGGAIAVARSVWARQAARGFALTRPPGHHATPDRAMGFCLLNNAALAAEDLLQNSGAQRVAIIDLDLHHGNGTQDIFYARGDVLYVSTHQIPLYPGTGDLTETGVGAGQGATLNLPMPPATGDEGFRTCMDQLILPVVERFAPEMILVSAGFDPHWRDPLGHLRLSAATYGRLVADLTRWADAHCEGRIALILEGGYDLEAAAACAQASVAALLGQPFRDPLGPSPRPEGKSWHTVLEAVKGIWGL